eukprot:scaffold209508_cov29-Tisochrysis_lutea.AAC.1
MCRDTWGFGGSINPACPKSYHPRVSGREEPSAEALPCSAAKLISSCAGPRGTRRSGVHKRSFPVTSVRFNKSIVVKPVELITYVLRTTVFAECDGQRLPLTWTGATGAPSQMDRVLPLSQP